MPVRVSCKSILVRVFLHNYFATMRPVLALWSVCSESKPPVALLTETAEAVKHERRRDGLKQSLEVGHA